LAKYRIVIRAFTLRRDAAASILFARLLEARGANVVVASSRDFVRTVRFWKPDAIVVNTVGQIRRAAKMAPDAAIVLWPGEGAQALETSDAMHLARAPQSYERLDLALLWGRQTEAFFHQSLPQADHSRLVVCGNPRLDVTKFNTALAHAEKRTIGFVGRYHTLNRYNAVPTVFSMQYPEKRDNVLWQVETFITMITAIHRIIAETDYTISIRPHPLEAPEGYDFMQEGPFAGRVEIDDSLDVGAWTARQRIILAPSSQSFYESYVLGVPTINLDGLTGTAETTRRLTPHAAMSQLVSYNPESFDALMSLVTQTPPPPPLHNTDVDTHLDEFHDWHSPRSALARSADATTTMLARRRRRRGAHLPTLLLRAWDRLSFARIHRRDPLHQNFNFQKNFHHSPAYFDEILENLEAGRSILGTETSRPESDGA
jgi:surface carbohydrate biosynthesis protein